MLQERVHDLVRALCDLGKTVLIETSGACDIAVCDPRAIEIVDLKTPSSGECERNLWSNLDHLTKRDEVKFVVGDRADYDWACGVIDEHGLLDRVNAVLMSPVFEQAPGDEIAGAPGLALRDLAEWIVADARPVRLQTQLHKWIWDPATRGV